MRPYVVVAVEQTALFHIETVVHSEERTAPDIPWADSATFVVRETLEDRHRVAAHHEHKTTVLDDNKLLAEDMKHLVGIQVVYFEEAETAEHPWDRPVDKHTIHLPFQ